MHEKIRSAIDQMRSASDQTKLIAVGGILGIVLIWLAIVAIPMFRGRPDAKELDTKGWNTVNELNEQLLQHPDYHDTSFVVESEKPLRLKLVGGVTDSRVLEDLKEFAAQIRPEGDFEVDVELLH